MNPPQDNLKKEIERLKLIIEEIRVVSNHNYELSKSETLKKVYEKIGQVYEELPEYNLEVGKIVNKIFDKIQQKLKELEQTKK